MKVISSNETDPPSETSSDLFPDWDQSKFLNPYWVFYTVTCLSVMNAASVNKLWSKKKRKSHDLMCLSTVTCIKKLKI